MRLYSGSQSYSLMGAAQVPEPQEAVTTNRLVLINGPDSSSVVLVAGPESSLVIETPAGEEVLRIGGGLRHP